MIPAKVQEQYEALLVAPRDLSREECERRFPDLVAYIREHTSLVDLLRGRGIEVRPLSPDAPNVFVAGQGCPDCGGDILVKEQS